MGSVAFGRLDREPRLADRVAELVLESIVTQRLSPGDRLPSERELGNQFGVSRTVVREAIRSLAAKGVVEARVGSGVRVAAASGNAASESLALFLRANGLLEYGPVNEVRTMLEVHIAGVAAERSTPESTGYLRSICREMADADGDVETASRADVRFHRAVAVATRNDLYVVLLDSLEHVLLDVRRATLGIDGRIATGITAHEAILEAIAAGEPATARRMMAAHLADAEAAWTRIQAAKP